MRPLRYSINVTLDGCCDHRAFVPDEDLHRHAAENIAQADALLFGRVTYEMMEAAWRPSAVAWPCCTWHVKSPRRANTCVTPTIGCAACGYAQAVMLQRILGDLV